LERIGKTHLHEFPLYRQIGLIIKIGRIILNEIRFKGIGFHNTRAEVLQFFHFIPAHPGLHAHIEYLTKTIG
jgi:hypothetical protein